MITFENEASNQEIMQIETAGGSVPTPVLQTTATPTHNFDDRLQIREQAATQENARPRGIETDPVHSGSLGEVDPNLMDMNSKQSPTKTRARKVSKGAKKKLANKMRTERTRNTSIGDAENISMANPPDALLHVQIQAKPRLQNPMKGRRFTPIAARNETLKNQQKLAMNNTFQAETSRHGFSSNASMRECERSHRSPSANDKYGNASYLPRIRQPSSRGIKPAVPADSVNQRYDKHVSQVHDKYKAQELHLNRLQNIKSTIEKMKNTDEKYQLAPEYCHSEARGVQMLAIQRSKLINRNYKLHDTMGEIYRKNLNLQKKLDAIQKYGTGISFWASGGRSSRTSKSPR